MGRHSKTSPRQATTHQTWQSRPIEVVDADTGEAHLVTDDAVDAGRDGIYIAACGRVVASASLTVGPRRACRSCAWMPSQRSRTSR